MSEADETFRKIKVGEYIRTDKGVIGKVKRIELDEIDKSLKWYVFDKKRYDMNFIDEIYINKPYIKKHSSNVIDLLEVGDILKYRLNNLSSIDVSEVILVTEGRTLKKYLSVKGYSLNQIEILSLVTKEQFKNVEYKI